jgi:hypothetical protein
MDLPECDLFVWTPRESAVIRVERQAPDEEAKMIRVLHEFWLAYVDKKRDANKFRCVVEPPEPLSELVTKAEGLVARMRKRIPFDAPSAIKKRPRFYPYEYTYSFKVFKEEEPMSDDAVDGDL